MKTPKCPLCGTSLKAIRGYDVQGVTTDWVAGCYNCFFQSSHFWKTKVECMERHYSRKNVKIKYSEAKYLFKELRRLAVEDILRKHLYLIEFVETEKRLTRNMIKFWWKSSTLRTSIKRILKGGQQ